MVKNDKLLDLGCLVTAGIDLGNDRLDKRARGRVGGELARCRRAALAVEPRG